MAQEPRTVKLGQHFLAGAKWKDNEGNPIQPISGELPIWHSTNSSVLVCIPSKENPGAASCQGIKPGESELNVIANFDFGDGPQQAGQKINITVVEHEQPEGEIVLSYGKIEPVS